MTLIDAVVVLRWAVSSLAIALVVMLAGVIIQLHTIAEELRGIRKEMARR